MITINCFIRTMNVIRSQCHDIVAKIFIFPCLQNQNKRYHFKVTLQSANLYKFHSMKVYGCDFIGTFASYSTVAHICAPPAAKG